MPAKRQRILRVVLSFFLLTGATLAALSLERSPPDQSNVESHNTVAAKPELTLNYGRQKLQLSLTSVSAEHEEAILQTLNEQFKGKQVRVDFHTALQAESEWDAVSNSLLVLVGATSSAQATISDNSVTIRGTSEHADAVEERLAALRDALPAEAIVDADILTTDASMTAAELCAQSFAPIAAQTIHFRQSSTELRDAAIPIMDRLVEFAYDCPDARIAIVGHTDSSGEESWNVQVGLARATAVAQYLTSRGIAERQLILEGAGSAHPIGDNATVAGRERNRRIEFELR